MANYATDDLRGGRSAQLPVSTISESCGVCKLCTEEHVNSYRDYSCVKHDALLSWVKTSFEEDIDHHDPYSEGIADPRGERLYALEFWRRPARLPKIVCRDRKGHKISSRQLLVSMPGSKSRSSVSQHKADRERIDLRVARQWMDTCRKKHGTRCSNPFKATPSYPAYLIDTELNCITQPGKEVPEYVALRYRWGGRKDFTTDQATVEFLKDPGGPAPYAEKIPPTIHHAMHIVRSVGERYLWVDSICLLSNDKEYHSQQLQLMGLIYARAKLTIVATDGDAWDGIQ